MKFLDKLKEVAVKAVDAIDTTADKVSRVYKEQGVDGLVRKADEKFTQLGSKTEQYISTLRTENKQVIERVQEEGKNLADKITGLANIGKKADSVQPANDEQVVVTVAVKPEVQVAADKEVAEVPKNVIKRAPRTAKPVEVAPVAATKPARKPAAKKATPKVVEPEVKAPARKPAARTATKVVAKTDAKPETKAVPKTAVKAAVKSTAKKVVKATEEVAAKPAPRRKKM